MARRMEHRTEFGHPAARAYAALTDEGAVRERLTQIGGRRSELVSYSSDDGTVTAVMRQGIDAEHLPGVVRKVAPDGVTIERTETWTGAQPDGSYRGTVRASVSGMPGSMEGTMSVADTGGGSQLLLDGQVKVGIPLVGGKIEGAIVDEIGKLLQAEGRFTNRWLESHQA